MHLHDQAKKYGGGENLEVVQQLKVGGSQLLDDDELRYAVAYSFYRTGDFVKSEEYLKSIERDDLFEKSLELRKEISKCKNESWACSETI